MTAPFAHRALLAAGLAATLAACASTPPPASWTQLLAQRGVDPSEVVDFLAPSDAMRRAAVTIPRKESPHEQLVALQAYFFTGPEAFRFQYDASGTYDAAGAFERRSGNCVAFTSLFLSMARLLDVPLLPAVARHEKSVERNGDLIVVTSHVVALHSEGGRFRIYDFSADRDGALGVVRVLDDAELLAAALSNRAVGDLQAGDTDAARVGLDLAARLAPRHPTLLANLGVVRQRLGDDKGAREMFDRALKLSPHDATILYDHAMLDLAAGRRAEALRTLARSDDSPSYVLLTRGELELASRDLDAALRSFQHARRLSPATVEPLLGLARVETARGHRDEARRLLEQALALAPGDRSALALLSANR